MAKVQPIKNCERCGTDVPNDRYVYCSTECQRLTGQARKSRDRVQRNRDYINAIKSAPCTDCGQTYPPYVMDLDHVRPGKRCNISELVAKGKGMALLVAEVLLCEVVCANCHRIRTHQRMINSDQQVIDIS